MWWSIGLALTLLAAWVFWVWGPSSKVVQIDDVKVRTFTAWGNRFAEIENTSERSIVIPNREGFFLYFQDPGITSADKVALIDLAGTTLLPPGGVLRIQIMDSYEPMFVMVERERYMDEAVAFARQCKARLWTAPKTAFP